MNRYHFKDCTLRRRQRGLTLIEIMVALVISLILTAGVIQIFTGSKQTYRFQEQLSRMQESGRFAIEMLSRELRSVGYDGCAGRSIDPVNTLNNPDNLAWNFQQGVFGNHSNGDGTWEPPLDPSITNPDPSPTSDVLTVRVPDFASEVPVDAHPGRPSAPGSANVHIPPGHSLEEGDIVMISTCQAAGIMQVTNVNTSGGTNALVHQTGNGTPGNETQELGANMTGGTVMQIATHTYYVAPGANGQPSLWRKVGVADAEELVENVERLEVTFGEDLDFPDGDGQIDTYENASDVNNWSHVLSVRVRLTLASSEDYIVDDVTPAGDRRLRQTMTTTVALRNRLP